METKLHYLLIGYTNSKTLEDSKRQWKEILEHINQELSKAREEGYADGVEHRKRRAMKYFMDGKVGDDLDLVEYADSTYKLTTK